MCAIVGSFDPKRFAFLADLNSYRGNHSYSLAWLGEDGRLKKLERGLGAMPNRFEINPGEFLLGHSQAPTSAIALGAATIHPAQTNGFYLWHNGILKAKTVGSLQELLGSSVEWDTQLLLDFLVSGGDLSQIDGSFACVYLTPTALFLFRNELVPLFYHPETFDLSSNHFPGSLPLEANRMFQLFLANKKIEERSSFKTFENPYYFT